MKTIATLLLLFAANLPATDFSSPLGGSSMTATRLAPRTVCTKTDVVMRSGPSRNNTPILCGDRKTLPADFRVEVLEETVAAEKISGVSGRWLRIEPPAGTGIVECGSAGHDQIWIFGGLVTDDLARCARQ